MLAKHTQVGSLKSITHSLFKQLTIHNDGWARTIQTLGINILLSRGTFFFFFWLKAINVHIEILSTNKSWPGRDELLNKYGKRKYEGKLLLQVKIDFCVSNFSKVVTSNFFKN